MFIYNTILKNIPSGYNHSSLFNYTKVNHTGNLLDSFYESSSNKISLQIAIGNQSNISFYQQTVEADKNYNFLKGILLNIYSTLNFAFITANETISEHQSYHSIANFYFKVDNISPNYTMYQLILQITFNNNNDYKYDSTTIQSTLLYDSNNIKIDTIKITQTEYNFQFNGSINAISSSIIIVKYLKFNSIVNDTFTYWFEATPIQDHYYFSQGAVINTSIILTETRNNSGTSDVIAYIATPLIFLFALSVGI